jgi:RimJ/RimL family protein N-acetyltransferase
VRIIETKDFTDRQWKRYYELRRRLAQRAGSSLESGNWWILKRRTLREMKELTDYRCAILEKRNDLAGYTFVHTIAKGTPDEHVRWLFDASLDKFSPGLTKRIARWVLSQYPLGTYTILGSYEKRNDAFARALGGRVAGRRHYFTLKVKDVKRTLMDSWIHEGKERNGNLRLRFFDSIPEKHLEEYCVLFTRLLQEMPRGSAAWLPVIKPERIRKQQRMNRKSDSVSYTCILFDGKGGIVGHTNVFIRRKKPNIAFQFMTGVSKEYRGRGLGRWMKAAMFRRLVKDFPQLEEIRTDTNPQNRWMIAINDQMGYRYSHSLKEFKIREKGLRAVLNERAQKRLFD